MGIKRLGKIAQRMKRRHVAEAEIDSQTQAAEAIHELHTGSGIPLNVTQYAAYSVKGMRRGARQRNQKR